MIRNALGQKHTLYNRNREKISWVFFEKLVQLQEKIGLTMANKFTQRHLQFQKNIMNVRLAAQTFSSSIATALQYREEERKLEEFSGARPTAEFCTYINNIFDILNCRNRFSQAQYNKPLSSNNIEDMRKYAQECEVYLAHIQDAEGHIIQQSNRKTGFLGFIICLQNIFKLYDVVVNHSMKYFLTYKISQDHIEKFFSSVRSRGGFNNNPSVRQFIAAYKRLLVRHQIASSKFGNCSM